MASASNSTTLYDNGSRPYTLTASFTENSTSVPNNTSNITCTATLTSLSTYWSSSYNSTLAIYWHDNRQNTDVYVASVNAKSIAQYGSITASGTINVTHNGDGSLSGYAYAYFEKGGTSAYTPNSGGVATNWTALTTIPRASIPSISGGNTFNIGNTITINMNRKSTAFTHTVTLYFGNYSYQIATGVTDNCTLNTSTIANQMYQQIPNAAAGQGNITVITYNGSTQVGTAQCLFTAKVVNSSPTFNVAYKDTNSTTTTITGNNQQIIRNKSTLQINITNAQAKNYATLSSAKCVINGTTYSATLSGASVNINVGVLNLSSNVTAQVSVVDSRGITTTKNLTITILNWVLPTAIISLQRQNNFYTETDINVNAEYSSLNNKNTITIKYRIKKKTTSTWGSYANLSDNVTSTFNADNQYEWDVQVLVQDKLGSTTYNLTLGIGLPIVYYDRKRSSTGFNCFPQNNGSVEIQGDLFVNSKNILNMFVGIGQVSRSASTSDWNTACGTTNGIYMGSNMSHSPSGDTVSGWWIVLHMAHNENYQRQVAFSFLNNENIYTRIKNNGTWGSWTLLGTSAKTTDANGWGKIDHPTYTEYFKKGTYDATFGGNGWDTMTLTNLPVGMSTLGSNVLTSSVIPSDGAINCTIGCNPTSGTIKLQWYNCYGGSVPATLYYDLRIIQFK